MRIEHATLDGQIIVTEVPDEPETTEDIERTAPTLENLAASVQVIAERVGMTKAEVETLVRSPRVAAPAERIRASPRPAAEGPT